MAEMTGYCAPEFEQVRDAFAANFDERGDVGAGVAVYRAGELVVDLQGGVTEPGGTTPYGPDHLQLIFSSTKGATAICAHILVDRGELDLNAPVAEYWPEFKAHGKGDVPVEWLLSHRVGLPDVDRALTLDQALAWDPAVEALAESIPVWEPGSDRGYHAVTYGYLVGEVVRRVSGKSLGEFFADEVAGPLGLDFWIGLPADQHERVVPLIPLGPPPGIHFGDPDAPPPGLIAMLQMLMGADSLIARALTAPGGAFSSEDDWNRPELWAAEVPAANGIANAGSVARMYAATVGEVDGIRLLGPDTLANAIEVRSTGPDQVLIFDIPFGLGFMRDSVMSKFGSPTAFGHYGAGGSVGFADHHHELGFGYVMNKMDLGIAGDPRTASLIDAVYASL
jgi:CubicO group peptidase (beta-lactamase class C family)